MSSTGPPSFYSSASSPPHVPPNYQYDFAKGHPNSDELPVQELQSLLSRSSLPSDDVPQGSLLLKEALQYGASAGKPRVLEQLSSFLEQQCRDDELFLSDDANDHDDPVSIESHQQPTFFFLTGGVSHALDLLVAALTRPGDIVWTECPTYYLAAGIFQSHHLQIGSLPMLEHGRGMDLDRLEEQLRVSPSTMRPHLIYTIPAHHNPVGHVLSARDRQRLALLAAEYDFVVLADEVYHLLDWQNANQDDTAAAAAAEQPQPRRRRPARMVQWNVQIPAPTEQQDPTNTSQSTFRPPQQHRQRWSGCISISALTKIFAPGVRFGWIETVDPAVMDALRHVGYIRSQGGVAPVTGLWVAQGLRDGTVNAVLTRLCHTYQVRCNLLCDILEQADPEETVKKAGDVDDDDGGLQLICRPCGGYFVWVRLPRQLGPVDEFLDYCRQRRGVNFLPGQRCSAGGSDERILLESYVRFCFAYLNTETLRRGTEAFVECYREYMLKMTK